MKRTTFSKDTRTAALYIRASLLKQEHSLERQERDLRAFAERAGYQVVAIYKETASGTKNDRKERAKLMALAQDRRVDAILVTELTRWGRNTEDLLHTVQKLAEWNVSLIAQSGLDFDVTTPSGKLMLTLLAGISQFERDLLAERTKSGIEAARARGKRIGRPTGNRTDDKHRDAVLSLIDQGFSYRDISSKLKISKDTIGRIVKN